MPKEKETAPGCVFSVFGKKFDVDATLEQFKFRPKPYMIWRKGDPWLETKSGKKVHKTSGFSVLVSDTTDFERAVKRAVRFLATNGTVIREIGYLPGMEMKVDFGIWNPMCGTNKPFCTSFHLPWHFLEVAGSLGIDFEITQYENEEA